LPVLSTKNNRYYTIITWAIARRIGLSTYDVKNGAIGSSIICPFYLPKITGTTDSTSMRDVISSFTTDHSEKNIRDATGSLEHALMQGKSKEILLL
jgi:hypothetical protein